MSSEDLSHTSMSCGMPLYFLWQTKGGEPIRNLYTTLTSVIPKTVRASTFAKSVMHKIVTFNLANRTIPEKLSITNQTLCVFWKIHDYFLQSYCTLNLKNSPIFSETRNNSLNFIEGTNFFLRREYCNLLVCQKCFELQMRKPKLPKLRKFQ